MEPTSARRVFPCFDEPDFKAEFEVTIIHRRITTALANGINTGKKTSSHNAKTQYSTSFLFKMIQYIVLILVFFVSTLSDGANIIDDDWKATAFQPTPLMSTYLFAFTVSEFTPTRSSNHRVEINVCVL